MSVTGAILGGLVGGGAMIAVLYPMLFMLPQQMKMDILKLLGTMFVPAGAAAYTAGLMVHGMMSVVFGLIHGGLLAAVDVESAGAGVGLGIVFGIGHALVVGMAMGMMPLMHPRMRPARPKLVPVAVGGSAISEDELQDPPGFFTLNYPPMTTAGFFMLHILFGIIVGAIYAGIA